MKHDKINVEEWHRRWADGKRDDADYADLAREVNDEVDHEVVLAVWADLTHPLNVRKARLVHRLLGRRVMACFGHEMPATDPRFV